MFFVYLQYTSDRATSPDIRRDLAIGGYNSDNHECRKVLKIRKHLSNRICQQYFGIFWRCGLV